jgi:hypothetical protein
MKQSNMDDMAYIIYFGWTQCHMGVKLGFTLGKMDKISWVSKRLEKKKINWSFKVIGQQLIVIDCLVTTKGQCETFISCVSVHCYIFYCLLVGVGVKI